MQEHLSRHFNCQGHQGFLEDISIILIDKKDCRDPNKRKDYWRRQSDWGQSLSIPIRGDKYCVWGTYISCVNFDILAKQERFSDPDFFFFFRWISCFCVCLCTCLYVVRVCVLVCIWCVCICIVLCICRSFFWCIYSRTLLLPLFLTLLLLFC